MVVGDSSPSKPSTELTEGQSRGLGVDPAQTRKNELKVYQKYGKGKRKLRRQGDAHTKERSATRMQRRREKKEKGLRATSAQPCRARHKRIHHRPTLQHVPTRLVARKSGRPLGPTRRLGGVLDRRHGQLGLHPLDRRIERVCSDGLGSGSHHSGRRPRWLGSHRGPGRGRPRRLGGAAGPRRTRRGACGRGGPGGGGDHGTQQAVCHL